MELSKEVSNDLWEIFKSHLQPEYELIYIDYRDDLENSQDIISECLDKEEPYPLWERTDDWFIESRGDGAIYERDEIKKTMLKTLSDKYEEYIIEYFFEEYEWEMREDIEDLDCSDPVKALLGKTRTRGRVVLFSNHEAMYSDWDMKSTYEYSGYFKNMIDLLYLNPAKVKKALIKIGLDTEGRFPNYKHRDGKEYVTYESLAEELNNNTAYSQLVFMGMMPLVELYDNNFQSPEFITIPKGNSCGLFSSWVGGGSLLEMELLRDLRIPYAKMKEESKYDYCDLFVDERKCDHGYCIDEVCGLVLEAWGEEFGLEFQEKEQSNNVQKAA